jgi:ABC-type transport system involved in multi-copper enzyme maturation permease subunit
VSLNATHVRSVIRKELRDYRRNRFIIGTMAIMPGVFVAFPIASFFALPASASSGGLAKHLGLSLLYLLLIPVIVPSSVASYSVVGEREQGTLEPLLTTPISREELIVGKAASALIPSVAIAYAGFGVFLASVELFAHANVSSAVFDEHSVLLAQALFTPLLAGWAIWVGIAISARVSDVRVAQQLGTLASIPPLALAALMSFRVIQPTLALALSVGVALLAIDVLAWRVVSALFDRERLITSAKASTNNTTSPNAEKGIIVSAPAMEKPTLRLSRKGSALVRHGTWEIEIDGNVAGSIANKETVELPVEPGHHTLRLGSHRHCSPERSFEAIDGQVVGFWCRGQMLWPIYLAALIKPDLWITLKPGT